MAQSNYYCSRFGADVTHWLNGGADVRGTLAVRIAHYRNAAARLNAAARELAGARWVLFALDAGRYALPLETVERIVRAAEITPLPLAPEVVLGAIDIAGDILPVFNLRRRFKLPERELAISDQLIIARSARRRVVLAVDAALGVIDAAAAPAVDGARLAPELAHIRGVISLEGGLVLIQDLERFLSTDEVQALDAAIHSETARRAR